MAAILWFVAGFVVGVWCSIFALAMTSAANDDDLPKPPNLR